MSSMNCHRGKYSCNSFDVIVEAEIDRLKAELEDIQTERANQVASVLDQRDRWKALAFDLVRAGDALWNVDQTEEVSKVWREAKAALEEAGDEYCGQG